MTLCYLDNSATTQPFDEVREAVSAAMATDWLNPSAAYEQAAGPRSLLEAARAAVAQALGGGRVVFTASGTEADNLALAGALTGGRRGIVTSAAEHPAVLRAAEGLGQRGAALTVLPVDETGAVRQDALQDALHEDTAIVRLMHVNNETGAINDLAQLGIAIKGRSPSALFHADGVQAFLRVPAEPRRWGVDLYSVSAHKIHGPKGVGALWMGPKVRLQAQMLGGGQEDGLRSGTENLPGIAGFGRAIEIYSQGLEQRRVELMEMKLALARELIAIEDAHVNGPVPENGAPHILNMSFDGVRGPVLLRALAEQGVLVSTGSACSARHPEPSPVLTAMGLPEGRVEGAVRFSLSTLNTMADIDRAVGAVRAQVARLRRFQRR